MSYCDGAGAETWGRRVRPTLWWEAGMDVFWVLVIGFLIVSFIFKTITAPARSADTLKRIERELKRRGE